MKLLILSYFFILLSGCAVSYLVEKNDTTALDLGFGCPDTFSVSGRSDFTTDLLDEGDMFRRDPQKGDYIKWIQEILIDQGCDSKYTVSKKGDLNIHVHEYYQPSDTGQGIGIMAMLTLYIVPLKADNLYRDIVISYKGKTVAYTLNERVWVGWYFLPVHPLSYLPHDKYFLEDKLKIALK